MFEEKSVWEPTQVLDWLGITWNSALGTLKIVERRIVKIINTIDHIIELYNDQNSIRRQSESMKRNYPRMFSPADDQVMMGSNLKTSGRRFQVSLS